MSSLLEDPMVLREIIMDHYQYPHNHKLTLLVIIEPFIPLRGLHI